MLGKRLISFLKRTPTSQLSSSEKPVQEPKISPWSRRVVSGALICVTGGVALSALDDLFIYHGCSSKAMEGASKNQAIIDAIGEPIVRGRWYNASLAVAHSRHSVSCTFPISGPQGTGTVQFKAFRTGDDTRYSFLFPRDWDVLIMEALVHVPSNEEKQRTFRINLLNNFPPPVSMACTGCSSPESCKLPEKCNHQN